MRYPVAGIWRTFALEWCLLFRGGSVPKDNKFGGYHDEIHQSLKTFDYLDAVNLRAEFRLRHKEWIEWFDGNIVQNFWLDAI